MIGRNVALTLGVWLTPIVRLQVSAGVVDAQPAQSVCSHPWAAVARIVAGPAGS